LDRTQIALLALALGLMLFAMTQGGLFGPAPEPVPAQTATGEMAPPIAQTPAGSPGSPEQPMAGSGSPAPPEGTPSPVRAMPEATTALDMTQSERIVLSNDVLRLEVGSLGGRLHSAQLLEFRDQIGPDAQNVELVSDSAHGSGLVFLGRDDFAGLEDVVHRVVSHSDRSVEFRAELDGIEVTRTVTLDDAGYGARVRISVVNHSERSVRPRFEYVWYGRERPAQAPDHFLNYQLIASVDGGLERVMVSGIHSSSGFLGLFGGGGAPTGDEFAAPVEWAGIESQYFLLAAISEQAADSSAWLGPIAPDTGMASLRYRTFEVPPQRQIERSYRLYIGPKTPASTGLVDSRLVPAAYVGWSWVRPFVDLFAYLLRWIYNNLVANYGVAIIMLTILLRFVTFPLTQRSMKSMKKMGVIAPDMKLIQAQYKDDSQRMQSEMMALYKRTGINPASALGGGCLPMLLQMPFMLALYFALQGTIELRHAPFMLWIQDLSVPEDFFSIAGLPIRPLPLLMGASMLGQQWLTPATGDPQQRRMMMWMNVAFIFLFYQFPSGLVLYWFVSNLLGILQQLLINRGDDSAPATPAKTPAKTPTKAQGEAK
jgi:YidC/Oxa1 family membrane protein insertase